MSPEIIYPLLAMTLTAISIGGSLFFQRASAKKSDIDILKKDLIEVKDRLTKCETARETLTNDRVAILEKVALQSLSAVQKPVVVPVTIAPIPHTSIEPTPPETQPVSEITASKVQVKAV